MSSKSVFTYREALDLFPQVRDLTTQAIGQVEALFNGLKSRGDIEERQEEIETAYRRIVELWAHEVVSLGCEVKGLWLVDWDSGDGYYCWRYPEESIIYFHSYEDGFQGRVPIT